MEKSTSRRLRLSSRSSLIPGIRYIRWANGVCPPRADSSPTTMITYQIHQCRASGRWRHRRTKSEQVAIRARMPM